MNWETKKWKKINNMQRGTDVTNLSDKDSWGKEGWGFWRKKALIRECGKVIFYGLVIV